MKMLYLIIILSSLFVSCVRKHERNNLNIKYTNEFVNNMTEQVDSNTEIITENLTSLPDLDIDELIRISRINYGNRNGTILERRAINGSNFIIRKYETKNNQIGLAYNVYKLPADKNSEIIYRLNTNHPVSTLKIAYNEEWREMIKRNNIPNLWVEIETESGIIGWIEVKGFDPFSDNQWIILDRIDYDGTVFTKRELRQWLLTTERLNVRDQPGINGKIIHQLEKFTQIDTLAITEEKVIIDGIEDHWVYIVLEDGRTGWVFGGYTNADRGPPRFLTPEEFISLWLWMANEF